MVIPNLGFGGAQRVFHYHATVLAEQFEVVECAFNLDQKEVYPSVSRFLTLDIPGGSTVFSKLWYFFKRCRKLNQIKKKEKPSITISHLEGADYINILSFSYGKKVLVVHGSKIHDKEMDSSFGWARREVFIPFLYKKADLIIAVSEGIQFELVHKLGLPPEKVSVIHNFFPIEKLKALAREDLGLVKNEKRTQFRIISSGRLAEPKNFKALIHIANELKAKAFNSQIILIGDGPLKSELQKECDNLRLKWQELNSLIGLQGETDIAFLGFQENPFKFYKEADLFLLTSQWEGFPMALGEAMVLGMPIISSDCPPNGPLELLEPSWVEKFPIKQYPYLSKNGILLPIPDVEDPKSILLWADTIIKLLNDKELCENFSRSVTERMKSLDQEAIKNKWVNVLNKLSGEEKSHRNC